jgi:hypothetical protein
MAPVIQSGATRPTVPPLAGAESLEVVVEAGDGREVLGAVDLHPPASS